MDALLERFADWPRRQRIVLLAGAMLLVTYAYLSLVFWPRSTEIAEKEKRLSSVQADRDRKAMLAANVEAAKRVVQELTGALDQAMAQLPDTKEIPDLLSNVSDAGRAAGLEVMQFRQRAEQYREYYAEVPVEIVVRGTYFQVEAFLDRVAKLTRIVNISNLAMKAPATIEGDPVRLETACAATTFRFLDEAERQRSAKEREKAKK